MTREVMDLVRTSVHDRNMLTTRTTNTNTSRATAAETTLRRVLTVNATTSGLGGLAALVFGGAVGDLLGVDRIGWVRIVGVGLVAFAAFVLFVARSSAEILRAETPTISVGDAAWVGGTVVTIALGWYSTTGAVVMVVVGLVVGALGATQMTLVRRLRSDD